MWEVCCRNSRRDSGRMSGLVTGGIQVVIDMSTTFKQQYSVGDGVGVQYVATVGAEGSASMPMKIDFPKGLTQADWRVRSA